MSSEYVGGVPFVDQIITTVSDDGQVVIFTLKFNNNQIGAFVITREHWQELPEAIQSLETKFLKFKEMPQ